MEQSPSRRATSSSAFQYILGILCIQKVHYSVHHSPPPVSILRQMNPVHATPSCISNPLNAELNPICPLLALFGTHHILHISRISVNIYFNIILLCWHFPNNPFLSRVPTDSMYAFLFSPIHVTCQAHLILHDSIARIIITENTINPKAPHYVIFSNLLLLPPYSLLRPNTFLSTLV